MLFAVDAGNTHLTLGVYRGSDLVAHWRLKTDPSQSVDGWGVLFRNLFSLADLDIGEISGIIISSVVPQLNASLDETARRYLGTEPLFVTTDIDTGITVKTDNPSEVGADRIVNAVAAFSRYGGPCIVVDFGTAITLDAISSQGEYLGGAICPGIAIASEALFRRTARLPQIELLKPAKVIGSNTVASLQAGLYYGTLGMVDAILERIIAELGGAAKVVATGGQARVICPASRYIEEINEHLTLEGLRIIWDKNRDS
jgi:type III pantothenate kinase